MKPLVPAQWPTLIHPGSRVFLGSGAACPHALIAEMLKQARDLKDIELVHILTLGDCPWTEPALADTFSTNTFFLGAATRRAYAAGRADYTPCFLSEIPGLFADRVLPLDAALVMVTPPDEQGFCSLGPSVDVTLAACRHAAIVIAQVNPLLPRTHGQSFLHVSEIDAFFEASAELPVLDHPPLEDPAGRRIAGYVAQLIEDGDTLQFGIGRLPETILDALAGHRRLGVHSEMISDGLVRLIRAGVVDNSRKTLHPGKSVVTFAMGTAEVYRFIHDNPHVEFHPTEYVNAPLTVARHERMVAVNSALEIDLTGQVAADSLGYAIHSGIGGQLDFLRGAAMSPGGRPIIALPSTARGGAVSRLVPHLTEGAGVVTSRGDVYYVVTEYGIATLRGRSLRERALELIAVAHPDFREGLARHAREKGLLPALHAAALPEKAGGPGPAEKKIVLKGETFHLRPLRPSDQRHLQEFFYSHSEETILMRYGHVVNRMDRGRAYELVTIDQTRDLALGIFEVQGPRQLIHAVGRYYLDRGGESAEVAFVVRETRRRLGMATLLFEEILAIARERGLKRIWGRVRRDNLPMLKLFRQFGAKPRPGADGDGETDLEVDLVAPPAPVRPASGRKARR
ncbi:MAG: GNAT family N-acetyltransferase [Puniceicoccaceae bacterium]|nr:MAG: GNAT family N-acetyltransferase [Puniceicoccaceae bacterium]